MCGGILMALVKTCPWERGRLARSSLGPPTGKVKPTREGAPQTAHVRGTRGARASRPRSQDGRHTFCAKPMNDDDGGCAAHETR